MPLLTLITWVWVFAVNSSQGQLNLSLSHLFVWSTCHRKISVMVDHVTWHMSLTLPFSALPSLFLFPPSPFSLLPSPPELQPLNPARAEVFNPWSADPRGLWQVAGQKTEKTIHSPVASITIYVQLGCVVGTRCACMHLCVSVSHYSGINRILLTIWTNL